MGALSDRVVLITGASMGIGLAIARQCAEEGARLVLASRHMEDLERALEGLKRNGSAHICRSIDVGNADEVSMAAQAVKKEFGRIDGLVNCAGVYGPIGRLDEIDPNAFREAINVNLLGTFNMCHYFLPLLKKSSRGKIVNYSGGGAATPFPNYSAYAVGKTGVVRLTENIALEFRGENIDINAVAPGFVITRLHQDTLKAGKAAGEGFLKSTKEQIEKGGVSPGLSARLTVFLLSGLSDGITGKFISAPWDPWEEKGFIERLKTDRDYATLRRIDNKTFFKREG
ncbi:MAG: SDR family oxidoreductase [Deltaproteobacteria bacterium]